MSNHSTMHKQLRSWGMKHPRPHRVRITAADGEKHVLEIEPRASWSRVASSLEAYDSTLLEALNTKGEIIRALRPADIDLDEDEDEDAETEADPRTPVATPFDNETQRMALVAQLVGDAYKTAQAQAGINNETAFNRLVDLCDSLGEQVRASASALEHANQLITKLSADKIKAELRASALASSGGGGEKGDLLAELFDAFMSGKRGAVVDTDADDVEDPVPNGADPEGKDPH